MATREVLLDFRPTGKTGSDNENTYVAIVQLNRPKVKNALSKSMSLELAKVLDSVRIRHDVCAVVLTGAGKCFSAGVDLKDPLFADPSMMTEESLFGPINYFWQLQNIKCPIIAAVAGPCYTGAFEIALNCDIIVASESAVFRDTHTLFGIVPSGGMTQLLPRSIGMHSAKWASLTAAPLNADRALTLGLVSKIVPDEDKLLSTAVEIAQSLAGRDPVVSLVKHMQHSGWKYDVREALKYELTTAMQSYKDFARNSAKTKSSLSAKFAARSKL